MNNEAAQIRVDLLHSNVRKICHKAPGRTMFHECSYSTLPQVYARPTGRSTTEEQLQQPQQQLPEEAP